jgi:hypothetical protein
MEKTNQTKLKNCLITLIMIFGLHQGFSQTTYWPSSAGGNWNAGAAWSKVSCGNTTNCFCTPGLSNDIVNLTCAKTITVTSSASTGAIAISGGTLIINSGVTLTCTSLNMTSGTLTVNGTLTVTSGGTGAFTITGGTFTQAPTATGKVTLSGGLQNITCTQPFYDLNIAGSGNKTMLSNVTVANQLQLTTNNLIVGSNTLTVGSSSGGNGITQSSGKLTLSNTSSLSLGGFYDNTDISTIISNSWPLTIANFTMTRNLCTVGLGSSHNLTVTGAFTLTAGDFYIGASTLTLSGAISGNINGSIRGGTSSDLVVNGSGLASMYFDLTSFTNPGGTNSIRNFTNNRTSNSFILLSSLRIGGLLTEAAGSSITISNGSFQTLTIDGTVSGTAALVGHANASLSILGSGSMGGTLTFASVPTLSNLTMNRMLTGTATIGSAVSVGGLSLTSGVLTNANLTTVTGSAPANVSNTSSSSYLAGALARNIAPGSSSVAYVFPIGKGAPQKLSFNGLTTGGSGNVVIRAEAFDGNSNGTFDATMASRNTDNYWSASTTSNAANLVSAGTVSLNDTAIAAGSVVGYAPTQAGIYTSLGGSISSPTITSVIDSPSALGFYNIGGAGVSCTNADAPTISATSTTNCGAVPTTLSIASGLLNSATNWVWYSGNTCGIGTPVGSGTSIIVSPAATTAYWVRGEGGCTTPGSCARVTLSVTTPQNWYLDADSDGHYISGPVVQCVSPGEGYNITATVFGDCNDNNAAYYQSAMLFVDGDADGYTVGAASAVCYGVSIPSGYSATSLGTDCNDNNINVYQSASFYHDNDSDGYDAGLQTICYGPAVPLGFILVSSGADCNDNDNSIHQNFDFYTDGDGDGYGAGAVVALCVAGASPVPSGYSLNDDDCDDLKSAIHPLAAEIGYNLIDDDCDGLTDEGFPPKATVIQGVMCNSVLPAIDTQLFANLVAGAQGYRWRISTLSATGGVTEVQELSTQLRVMKLTQLPHYAFNTTYRVEVAVYYTGYLQPFTASTCTVTTPSPTTSLAVCGQTLTTLGNIIYANLVPYAAGYRFQIVEVGNALHTQNLDRPLREFRMNLITNFPVQYGKTYQVRVAVKNTDGSYLPFGSVCNVTTPTFPSVATQDAQCNNYLVPSFSTPIYAYSQAGAIAYVFNLSLGEPESGIEVTKSVRAFTLNDFAGQPLIPGATYNLRVRLIFNSTDSPGTYGKTCTITLPGSFRQIKPSALSFEAIASPNPFANNFHLNVTAASDEDIVLKVYDMTGRLLENGPVKGREFDSLEIGQQYPSGVYNVLVSQGAELKVLRVVKQ